MDPITGAVVIAGLKYGVEPTAEGLKEIIGKILGPSAAAVGEGIAAPLKAWAKQRGDQAARTTVDAAKVLQAAEITPQSVPGRLLWPLLESASLEESEDLHLRWVGLLANSATPG